MTADTVGGVWTYALELIRGLQPLGVEVALATMGAPLRPAQEKEAAAIPNLELFTSSFKLEWMEEPWSEVEEAGQWLLGIEASIAPAIIHLNGYCHGALPWKAPALVVGHSCVLSWWSAVKGESAPDCWRRYRDELRRGMQATALVAAPSQSMLAELARHYGPFRNTKVIANGRSAERFRPGRKDALIFSAGRLWDEAKNISAIAAVAPDLDWPVYLAGDPLHPSGRSISFDSVHLLGPLASDQILDWLRRASIYALPVRYEPFGLSILEAALCGCALVLGNIPSLKEMWRGAALFVSPDDPDEVRYALQWLIKHPAARQGLAQTARKRAAQFTPERMAAAYFAAYKELMQPEPLPAAFTPAPAQPKEAVCAS
jgi:glycogen synthase